MKTAMEKAFATTGVTRRDNDFKIAIALFCNRGGTRDEAVAIINTEYDRMGGDRFMSVTIGDQQVCVSPARGADRTPSVHKTDHAVFAPRAPNPPRGAAAIAAVQPTMARSLFDTIVLPDGRPLRKVRWHECPDLARQYRTIAHILLAVHNSGVPTDTTDTLDKIVTEKELKRIVKTAERSNKP